MEHDSIDNGGLSNSPFSDEIPQLLKRHVEHLKASAISIEVIKERGYKSVLGKTEACNLTAIACRDS